jgi:hypothetical protein
LTISRIDSAGNAELYNRGSNTNVVEDVAGYFTRP